MEEREDVRALWLQRKSEAHVDVIRGVTQLLMSVPIVVAGGLLAFMLGGNYSVMIALLILAFALATIGSGAMRVARGTRERHRATKELELLGPAALPPARVVERT